MKNLKKTLAVILTLAFVFTMVISFGNTKAKAEDSFTLKVSTTRGEGTWYAQFYDDIAKTVEEKSQGRLKLEMYHNNTLGAPPDLWTMFTAGALDGFDCSPGMVGDFVVSNLLNMPFYFDSAEQVKDTMWALYDEGLLPEYSDYMHVLAFLPNGGLELMTTKKQVESMDDIAGMKLRGSSQLLSEAIDMLGATAVSVQNSDITMSLSQGVLDGIITGAGYGMVIGLDDCCKYLMDYDMAVSCMFFGINNASWEKLPEDLQTLLQETVDEAVEAVWMPSLATDYTDGVNVMIGRSGLTVYQPTEEFVAAMKDATAPLMDKYVETLTAAGIDADAVMAIANGVADAANK